MDTDTTWCDQRLDHSRLSGPNFVWHACGGVHMCAPPMTDERMAVVFSKKSFPQVWQVKWHCIFHTVAYMQPAGDRARASLRLNRIRGVRCTQQNTSESESSCGSLADNNSRCPEHAEPHSLWSHTLCQSRDPA